MKGETNQLKNKHVLSLEQEAIGESEQPQQTTKAVPSVVLPPDKGRKLVFDNFDFRQQVHTMTEEHQNTNTNTCPLRMSLLRRSMTQSSMEVFRQSKKKDRHHAACRSFSSHIQLCHRSTNLEPKPSAPPPEISLDALHKAKLIVECTDTQGNCYGGKYNYFSSYVNLRF